MLLYISFLSMFWWMVCRHQFGCVYPALVFIHVSSNCFCDGGGDAHALNVFV